MSHATDSIFPPAGPRDGPHPSSQLQKEEEAPNLVQGSLPEYAQGRPEWSRTALGCSLRNRARSSKAGPEQLPTSDHQGLTVSQGCSRGPLSSGQASLPLSSSHGSQATLHAFLQALTPSWDAFPSPKTPCGSPVLFNSLFQQYREWEMRPRGPIQL